MGTVPVCVKCDPCDPSSKDGEVIRIKTASALTGGPGELGRPSESSEIGSAIERAEAAGLHPIVTAGPEFSRCISLINACVLRELPVPWPRLQDLPSEYFLEAKSDTLVVAVSHGWAYQAHPDPTGAKGTVVRDLLDNVLRARNHSGHTIVFFDFCSIPQRAFLAGQADRTEHEQAQFNKALSCMPSVFLLADAVVHVDMPLPAYHCKGDLVQVDAADLKGSNFLQLGQRLQVGRPGGPNVHIFDIVVSCDGESGLTAAQILERLASARSEERACPVVLERMPFGLQNDTPVGDRGWIYLERFVAMVKSAMVDESEFERVCFSNSQAVLEHIRAGSARLRQAALQGRSHIQRELEEFYRELDRMRFSGTSTDKILDSGVRTKETDRDAVARIMHDMVVQLPALWSKEQQRQRQRQLMMAVNCGDAKVIGALLCARADVNYPGKAGETCLHKAALQDSIDVARVLLKHQANVNLQDGQGNCAGHSVFLAVSEHVVDFFDLLVPNHATMVLRNFRQLTPLHRFASWAVTGDSGHPYEPAMAYLERVHEAHPELSSPERPLVRDLSVKSAESFGGRLYHTMRNMEIFGHTVCVEQWSPVIGEADRHVLWISFAALVPPAMQRLAVDQITRRLTTKHRVKFFVLTKIGGLFRGISLPELQEKLLYIVECLELHKKFMFVDESRGVALGLLTMLRPRLMGALLINTHLCTAEDFLEGAGWAKLQDILLNCARLWCEGDVRNLAEHCSTFVHLKDANLVEGVVERFRVALERESQDYHDLNVWIWERLAGEWAGFASRLARESLPFVGLPSVLAFGAFAPEGVVAHSLVQLRSLFPEAAIAYIANSNLAYQLEGQEQLRSVVNVVEELLDMVDGIRPGEPLPWQPTWQHALSGQ